MRATTLCPSDFALERFVLGELPAGAFDVASHVDGCEPCRAKVAEKKADDADFMRSPEALDVKRKLSPWNGATATRPSAAPRMRRAAFAGFALAAAMAVSFAVWHRHTPSGAPSFVPQTDEEAAVLRVQHEWMEAVRDKDAAALDRILADDYTYTDSGGSVSNKADSLRQARTGGGHMKAFHTSDAKARVYGDMAIITGRVRMEGVARGEPYDSEVRFTDILARIDGQWRAVAAHASRPSELRAP
jgi:ketosteroid isomerase-like protein